MDTNGQTHARHPMAHPKGGIMLRDDGGVITKAFKEFIATLAKKLVKGQFYDMLKTSAPAFIHYPRTYLENACVSLSFTSKFMN